MVFLQVLCIIILICAAITLSTINDIEEFLEILSIEYEDSDNYKAAAGWLIFVAVVGMIIEALKIFLCIVNFSIINQHLVTLTIVVSR